MFRLEGKTALITGAANGIGQAIAVAFARQGADVAVTDKPEVNREQTMALLAPLGRRVIETAIDVRDMDQIRAGCRKVNDAFGRVDILVNNAGINRPTPGLEVTAGQLGRPFQHQRSRRIFHGAGGGAGHDRAQTGTDHLHFQPVRADRDSRPAGLLLQQRRHHPARAHAGRGVGKARDHRKQHRPDVYRDQFHPQAAAEPGVPQVCAGDDSVREAGHGRGYCRGCRLPCQ